MYERNWGKRVAIAATIAVFVCAVWIASARGVIVLPFTDGGIPEDGPDQLRYGQISKKPSRYQQEMFQDRWMHKIPIGNSTFGNLLLQQRRFAITGRGSMERRDIEAQTASAVSLLNGDVGTRTTKFLRGIQTTLADRDAYITHLSLSDSQDGYVANFVSIYVEQGYFNGLQYRPDLQRKYSQELHEEMKKNDHSWAWYQFDASRIVVGPELSKTLERILRTPKKVSKARQLFVAYVLRHEIEHATSAYDQDWYDDFSIGWIEESVADVMARWPGEAAKTAEAFGFAYPQSARRLTVDQVMRSSGTKHISGYDEPVTVLRKLLSLAGIGTTSPTDYEEADKLLQGGELPDTAERIAAAIIEHQGVTPGNKKWLTRKIADLYGDPAAMRKLEREIKGRVR